jgi:hypothetical protein
MIVPSREVVVVVKVDPVEVVEVLVVATEEVVVAVVEVRW